MQIHLNRTYANSHHRATNAGNHTNLSVIHIIFTQKLLNSSPGDILPLLKWRLSSRKRQNTKKYHGHSTWAPPPLEKTKQITHCSAFRSLSVSSTDAELSPNKKTNKQRQHTVLLEQQYYSMHNTHQSTKIQEY